MYIFNHIPKCAGVSYLVLLQRIFGTDGVLHINLNEDIDYSVDARDFQKYRVIMGHFGVKWNQVIGPSRRWLTAIRDPVDRVVSTYFFWRNNAPANSDLPYVRLAQTLPLDEFIRSDHYLVRQGISNAQTWQLADDLRARYRNVSEEDALEVAKSNLEKFDFIGIYKRFSHSVARLCDYVGVPVPSEVPHENGTRERVSVSDLSPTTLQIIKELNVADIGLYEFGEKIASANVSGRPIELSP